MIISTWAELWNSAILNRLMSIMWTRWNAQTSAHAHFSDALIKFTLINKLRWLTANATIRTIDIIRWAIRDPRTIFQMWFSDIWFFVFFNYYCCIIIIFGARLSTVAGSSRSRYKWNEKWNRYASSFKICHVSQMQRAQRLLFIIKWYNVFKCAYIRLLGWRTKEKKTTALVDSFREIRRNIWNIRYCEFASRLRCCTPFFAMAKRILLQWTACGDIWDYIFLYILVIAITMLAQSKQTHENASI